MILCIAGSRTITDEDVVRKAVQESGWWPEVTLVIHGGCPTGVDAIADRLIRAQGKVPIEVYEADWKAHGKSAGPRRNRVMAAKADRLVAISKGGSPGTANMVEEMMHLGKAVFVKYV